MRGSFQLSFEQRAFRITGIESFRGIASRFFAGDSFVAGYLLEMVTAQPGALSGIEIPV